MTRSAQIWSASRLAELPERCCAALLPSSVERRYERGESVAWKSPRVSLVISGQVCGYLAGLSGRRVAYRYYGSGEVMGLLSVINPRADRNLVRIEYAAVRETLMLELPAGRLREMTSSDPIATQVIAKLVAQDLLEGHRGLADYIFLSVRQMLARHLLKRAIYIGDDLVVKATQDELASAIGSVRAVVARTLLELRADGLVDRTKLGIIIIDTLALAAEAKGQSFAGHGTPSPPPGSTRRERPGGVPPGLRPVGEAPDHEGVMSESQTSVT